MERITLTIDAFLQHLANGISLGSLYTLIAISYTMVYGILRLINFAHGEIFMLSTYVALYGVALFTLPWQLAFLLAILITGLMGVLIKKAAYSPLRESPKMSVLISAIGISFFLQNLGLVIFTGRPKTFPRPDFLQKCLILVELK